MGYILLFKNYNHQIPKDLSVFHAIYVKRDARSRFHFERELITDFIPHSERELFRVTSAAPRYTP